MHEPRRSAPQRPMTDLTMISSVLRRSLVPRRRLFIEETHHVCIMSPLASAVSLRRMALSTKTSFFIWNIDCSSWLDCEWLVSEPIGDCGCSDFYIAKPARTSKRVSSNRHCVYQTGEHRRQLAKSRQNQPSHPRLFYQTGEHRSLQNLVER